MKVFFQFTNFVNYLLRASNAHKIHSPFVYDIYTKIITDSTPYYSFTNAEMARSRMLNSNVELLVEDFGTGGILKKEKKLSISYIASHYIKPKKYGQLLFRLVNHFQPKNILEIGTSLGITTLYIALPDRRNNVVTLEGSIETARIAALNFQMENVSNINVITGEFSKTLPKTIKKLESLDFVYFDGNHRKLPTLNYFEQCLKIHNDKSIFIFDDIYHSKEMKEAWAAIKEHPAVTLTIDLFSLGIVFFIKQPAKQHFTLRF